MEAKPKQTGLNIKTKLIIAFAIPLIVTVVFGICSVSVAKSGMSRNYENSMSRALMMAMEYLDFGFESAVSESEQLYYDTDLVRWATGAIYNDWTRKTVAEDVAVDLHVKENNNDFVRNIYIIPSKGLPMISSNTEDEDKEIEGFYEEMMEQAEGQSLKELKGAWMGEHKYIDEILAKSVEGFSSSNYACSYIRPMTTKSACIVVDYSSESIAGILQNLDLGEGSFAAFVTADGREILLKDGELAADNSFRFSDQGFFTESMADNAATIIDYVKYNGRQYLFMVTKSHNNGSALSVMVPVNKVSADANAIKTLLVVMVVFATIIAVLACLLIITGIMAVIRHISTKMKILSEGDLTVDININRKDEFKLLVRSISDMVKNTKDLVVRVLRTTENVSASTEKLEEASYTLTESNGQIAVAVDEMDQGINQQSADAQNCLAMMDELSNRITSAVDVVESMNSITRDTREVIAGSMGTMDELSAKSQDTTDITRKVTENVQNLEQSLGEIENFMSVINGIAEETSLLALNASIEAARAGEAGKGFSVVAQSVGKLADGTLEASNKIADVVSKIRESAMDTVAVATEANDIVSKQAGTVDDTVSLFKQMNDNLESLMSNMDNLKKNIEQMESHRAGTLNAIENISSVSEETAASVSLVNESLKKQMDIVAGLNSSMLELADRSAELDEAVHVFRI